MAKSRPHDEILYCARCGISFVWTQEEQRALAPGEQPKAPRHCPGCRVLMPAPGRERGLVKWYNRRKQYGFIIRAGADEIYMHRNAIMGRLPRPGDLVEFATEETERGPAAASVKVIHTAGQNDKDAS
ncbi:MAG: cold shock domain-containing protein [Caldilineaceae bacterium]|nr:cold shock domain-containing protein [Caldilineaceae bacterium]